ncbi:MAG: ADP-ribosylglycohydrolase family protein [Gemmatimonadaceae bacterium]|nr:ADP-ribosylglycohydrolase family protein [Gemmatimonadaceae bacterium]
MVREWTAHVGVNAHRLESAHPIPSLAAISHARWEHIRPRADVTLAQRDRVRGALIGLAVGDAVGTTVEFRSPGTFEPVTDMIGGGPFHLSPGQWTDDTSMALCLAHSLIERRTFDARDQMQRYVNWRDNGYLSSTDRCFDIGSTVSQSLRRFERDDDPFAGVTRGRTAGNGSLMRLAPIAMYYFDQYQVLQMAADSSRTTHGARVAIDCCRYLAGLIVGAIRGITKDLLLAPDFEPFPGCWDIEPLHPAVQMVVFGSYKRKKPPEIRGRGYAVDALEAALWAFYRSDNYREGCLLAVNLGDDADTTAAIYGQLAGAFYGERGIPAEWRSRLARKDLLDRTAEALFQLAFDRVPSLGTLTEHAHAQRAELLSAEAGDAHQALAKFLAAERAAKEEMGVFEYYMSGPSYGQALHDEVRLQLRIEAGLALQA